MATLEGLDDQMLGIVVGKDEPEKEAKREELVIEQAKMQKQLRDIEDKILHLLSSASGNILDDEVLIDTLQKSKTVSRKKKFFFIIFFIIKFLASDYLILISNLIS